MIERLILAVSLLGADRGPRPVSCPSEDKSPPRTLILETAAGVVLVDVCSDGNVTEPRPIIKGQFKAILHDAWLDLLWVQGEDAISVFDLRVLDGGLTRIAANVPYEATFSIISNGQRIRPQVERPGDLEYQPFSVTFDLSRREMKLEDASESADAPQFLGKAAMEQWEKRQRNVAPEVAALSSKPRIVRNYPTGPCRPASDCGSWAPFGSHPDVRIVKIASLEDEEGRRKTGCWLYNGDKRTWSSPVSQIGEVRPESKKPPKGATTCGPYWFDRDRKMYALDVRVCPSIGSCRFADGVVVDWLHPGYWVVDKPVP